MFLGFAAALYGAHTRYNDHGWVDATLRHSPGSGFCGVWLDRGWLCHSERVKAYFVFGWKISCHE